MTFLNNIKTAFNSDVESTESDRGDIVQTILIIAGFAVVVILVVNWIGSAITNKGADIAACIEGANTYNSASSAENCAEQNHASIGDNSFTKDSGYTGRYGTGTGTGG